MRREQIRRGNNKNMKHGFLHVGVARADEITPNLPLAAEAVALTLHQKWWKYANYFLTEPDCGNKCIIILFFFFFNPALEMTDSRWVFDQLESVSLPTFLTTGETGASAALSYSISSHHQKLLDRRWACGRKWTERKKEEPDWTSKQRSGGTERQLVENEGRLERSPRGRWICGITLSRWR